MSATMALNSHSMPSMIDTYSTRNDSRSDSEDYDDVSTVRNCSDRPSMLTPRPNILTDRPSMLSDRPSMLSENTFIDRPSMISATADNKVVETNDDENFDETINNESQNHKSGAAKRGKRKKYQKYTPEDRIAIGKYCFENGPAAARKAFQDRYPEMSESVTRGFRDKYKIMIGESAVYEFEQKRQRDLQTRVTPPPRGRPRKYKSLKEDDQVSLSPETNSSLKQDEDEETEIKTTTKEVKDEQESDNQIEYRHKSKSPTEFSKESNSQTECRHEPKLYPKYHHESSNHVREHRYEDKETRNEYQEERNNFTADDKLRIGKFCNHHGIAATRHHFRDEFTNLDEDDIHVFLKQYQHATSVSPSQHPQQPQVYVVECDDRVTMTTTKPTHSMSFTDQKRVDMYRTSSRNPVTSRQPLEYTSNNHVEHSPRRMEEYERRMDIHQSRSPTHSPPLRNMHHSPVISSHIIAPNTAIIHYPKKRSPEIMGDRMHHEVSRRYKRDYSSTMEVKVNGSYSSVEYPYDRKDHSGGDSPPGQGRSKRFKYQKYTPEDRFNIGKLCNDIGLGATVKVYREQFPRLNESVVRTFRNKYRELLEKGNGTPVAETIERKPSRRSMSTLVENEVVSQLRQFKSSHIELSDNFVIAVADNVIATNHPKEAANMKGMITKDWANSLLWKHKLLDKPSGNVNGVCCERCKTQLICPKCPN